MKRLLKYTLFTISIFCIGILNCYASVTTNTNDKIINFRAGTGRYVLVDHDGKDLTGVWYEDITKPDGFHINIKSIEDTKVVVDIFIDKDRTYNDVAISISNYSGTFSSGSLTGGFQLVDADNERLYIASKDEEIYGFIGDLDYDSNNIKFKECTPMNGFEFSHKNNKILFDNEIGVLNDLIGVCTFEKIDKKTSDISLKNVEVSTEESLKKQNFDQEPTDNTPSNNDNPQVDNIINSSEDKKDNVINTSTEDNNEEDKKDNNDKTVENPNTGIMVVSSLLIILVLLISIKAYKNKKGKVLFKISSIVLLFIIPFIAKAATTDSDITAIRSILLGEKEISDITLYDQNKDTKLTIDDLVITKILRTVPEISFSEGTVKAVDNNTYVEANRIINIKSKYDITSVKYCFTDSEGCEPNKNYDVNGNNVNVTIKYEVGNNQKVCVEASNSIGMIKRICDTKTYNIIKQKSILFVGDSIAYGYGNGGKSWAEYIATNYIDFKVEKNALNGYGLDPKVTVCDWEHVGRTCRLTDLVANKDKKVFDYVILEGGYNDISNTSPSTVSLSEYEAGLRNYISLTQKNYPGAKIGYIIVYQTPSVSRHDLTNETPYYNVMVKVLKELNIPYIDLWGGSADGKKFSDVLNGNKATYFPGNDYTHINANGYNYVSPYIYKWIKTIQ